MQKLWPFLTSQINVCDMFLLLKFTTLKIVMGFGWIGDWRNCKWEGIISWNYCHLYSFDDLTIFPLLLLPTLNLVTYITCYSIFKVRSLREKMNISPLASPWCFSVVVALCPLQCRLTVPDRCRPEAFPVMSAAIASLACQSASAVRFDLISHIISAHGPPSGRVDRIATQYGIHPSNPAFSLCGRGHILEPENS